MYRVAGQRFSATACGGGGPGPRVDHNRHRRAPPLDARAATGQQARMRKRLARSAGWLGAWALAGLFFATQNQVTYAQFAMHAAAASVLVCAKLCLDAAARLRRRGGRRQRLTLRNRLAEMAGEAGHHGLAAEQVQSARHLDAGGGEHARGVRRRRRSDGRGRTAGEDHRCEEPAWSAHGAHAAIAGSASNRCGTRRFLAGTERRRQGRIAVHARR